MKILKKLFLLSLFSIFFSGCSEEEINTTITQPLESQENTAEISKVSLDDQISNLEQKLATLKLEKKQLEKSKPEISGSPKDTLTPRLHSETTRDYEIEYVYDGDTYAVWIDGKKEKIRVLGIDTPEKTGGFRPEGCFGDDASIYAKKILSGKKVGLLKPKNYENTDKYGRLLRYVFLDGKDFGAHLIAEGYAFSYKRFSHPRLKYYNQLEKQAQKNKKGMWNPENCDYLRQK